MQLPQINLNGSDGMELALQYNQAYVALEKGMSLMAPICHGRDFQGLPESAYITARQEMVDRMKTVQSVCDDLKALALHCAQHAR